MESCKGFRITGILNNFGNAKQYKQFRRMSDNFTKLNRAEPHNPEILFLGNYPNLLKTYVKVLHSKTYM